MKKNFQKLLVVILIFIVFLFIGVNTNVSAATTPVFTIFTNPGEDSNIEMRINWHINVGSSGSYVEYTKKDDTTWDDVKTVFAEEELNTAFTSNNAIGTEIIQCGAVLSNLEPGTDYMYRVCLDTYKSETHYFKTGSQYFSFAWTSDFHTYYDDGRRLNNATANLEEAIKKNGGVDFVLSTGDTIAHGGTYQWWEQLSGASWIKNYMYADTLGNHDWMTKSGTTVALGASNIFFDANHNNPKNGYATQENMCYYFYYGDAIFICLNTEEYSTAQYNWCEEVLKNCDAQYKFIFQHYQMFNKTGTFNSAGYTRWYKLCDKYGVDVAFSGNSHVYVRSLSLYNGAVSTDSTKGTVYMVAPSSDGDRGEEPVELTANTALLAKNWAGGVYQVASSVVKVTDTGIMIRLINKGGEVLDQVNIPAKRGISSRIVKDLGDFDKEALESTIYLSVNSLDLSTAYLRYDKNAGEAIKNIKITDTTNNVIIYNGTFESGKSRMKLENFPIRELIDIEIELYYWDNVKKILKQEFISRKDYGELSDFDIVSEAEDSLTLSWLEEFEVDEVKNLQIVVNEEIVDIVEINVKTYTLSFDDLTPNIENSIVIKVIGPIDDTLAEEEVTFYYSKKITPTDITTTITLDDDSLILEWDEDFELDEVKDIQIYLNDQIVETIENKVKLFNIDLDKLIVNSNNKITIKVIGENDNVILEKDFNYSYNVIIPPTSISIDFKAETDNIYVSDTFALVANILPIDASTNIEWISSDASIATIDQNGFVTTLKEGEVTFTAKSLIDNAIIGTKTITIENNGKETISPKSGCESMMSLYMSLSMLGLALICRKRFMR